MFTEEELVELADFDAGIDAEDDYLTADEMRESRSRDRKIKLERLPNKERRIKESQAAYYAANKDKIKEYRAAAVDRCPPHKKSPCPFGAGQGQKRSEQKK